MAIEKNIVLDAKNLNCPLPVLKTKVMLSKMQTDEVLYIETTDPHSVIDFESYCAKTDHELLSIEESPNVIKIYIKCSGNK